MVDAFVILRFDISQGDASGSEVAVFQDIDEAQRAFEAGRTSGAYVDEGNFWGGARAYELARRSAAGYRTLDGTGDVGPNLLMAPPTVWCAEVNATWSSDPSRRRNWPGA